MMTTDQTGCNQGYVSTNNSDRNTFNNSNNGHAENTDCKYTSTFNGTSSAAPVLSGAIALILESNPNLTWRDVKHILASTADQVDPLIADMVLLGQYTAEPAWLTNGAGYKFHNWYGFGRVNVAAAVAAAKTYTAGSLGVLSTPNWDSSGVINLAIPDYDLIGSNHTINTANNLSVEAVQIRINVSHTYTGDLAIELTSPAGTKSILLNAAHGFGSDNNLTNMILLSNAFYGENTQGGWSVKILDLAGGDVGTLVDWSIKFYGH